MEMASHSILGSCPYSQEGDGIEHIHQEAGDRMPSYDSAYCSMIIASLLIKNLSLRAVKLVICLGSHSI